MKELNFVILILFLSISCFANDYEIGPLAKLQIKVHIWGEVKNPGLYRIEDKTNLLELISLSGGPTEYAKLSKIRITRRLDENRKEIIIFNLEKYLNNPSDTELPILMPQDTIYIPKNIKAAWREFIKILSELALIINMILLTREVIK